MVEGKRRRREVEMRTVDDDDEIFMVMEGWNVMT